MNLNQIIEGDALTVMKTWPPKIIQTCITSVPYWGLRDYGEEGQLGLEATPEEYVARMVEIFAEVRRVLRDDGTLWLNLGDSYSGSGRGRDADGTWNPGQGGSKQATNVGSTIGRQVNSKSLSKNLIEKGAIGNAWVKPPRGYKAKNLIDIPWRIAFALQADGWYLRSDIIWSKPNPMPESVTDRPTKAHEYLFLFAKSGTNQYWTHRDKNGTRKQPGPDYRWTDEITKEETAIKPDGWTIKNKMGWSRFNLWQGHDYYYDADAIRETSTGQNGMAANFKRESKESDVPGQLKHQHRTDREPTFDSGGRNRRTVWEIATQPYPEAHFATFPEKLVEPCILAGSNDRACGVCGAAWERQTNVEYVDAGGRGIDEKTLRDDAVQGGQAPGPQGFKYGRANKQVSTLGFRPTCEHDNGDSRSIILDPFMGSGTVALVALKNGRDYVGIELKPEYIEMAIQRLKPLGNRPCPQQGELL